MAQPSEPVRKVSATEGTPSLVPKGLHGSMSSMNPDNTYEPGLYDSDGDNTGNRPMVSILQSGEYEIPRTMG